jgi:hypothetical protein
MKIRALRYAYLATKSTLNKSAVNGGAQFPRDVASRKKVTVLKRAANSHNCGTRAGVALVSRERITAGEKAGKASSCRCCRRRRLVGASAAQAQWTLGLAAGHFCIGPAVPRAFTRAGSCIPCNSRLTVSGIRAMKHFCRYLSSSRRRPVLPLAAAARCGRAFNVTLPPAGISLAG